MTDTDTEPKPEWLKVLQESMIATNNRIAIVLLTKMYRAGHGLRFGIGIGHGIGIARKSRSSSN